MRIPLCASLLVLGLTACGPSPRSNPVPCYDWAGYEDGLYRIARNPADMEKYGGSLKRTLELNERRGRVPPGLYAEYGYFLFESGKKDEAIPFFEKEKALWPESTLLMNRLIALCQGLPLSPPAAPSAPQDAAVRGSS